MSVPAGYKATEAGVIPDDWEVRTLANLCRQIVDGTHFTPTYTREGVPFYSVENVTANDFKNAKFISRKDHELQNKRCNPERGDILMTRIGSLGDTRFIDWDVKASIYVSLALLKVGERIDPRFLYAYSRSQVFRQSVENRSLMSAVPKKINMGAIGDVPVPVPPTEAEQVAIAEALSDVDEAIAAAKAVISKKRALKTATMQALLSGTRRLPGFSDEWKVKALDKICPMQRGFDLPTRQIRTGNIPVVYSNGIAAYHNKAMVKAPGIVTGRSGTIGNVHYVDQDFWPHNTSLWVTSFCGNDPKFILYFLRKLGLARFASGSGVPTLNRNDFHSFRVKIPRPEEQIAIAAVLSDIDVDLSATEAELAKLRRLKAGMMQQLLTGKIRLI